jgi:Holliday junction resolvase RusA-like endonuclease
MQTILGQVPSKSNGYKVGGKGMYKSKKVTDYERSFYLQCTKYRDANIDTDFALIIDVYFKTTASDLDGCFKVILDVLQHKVKAITNDNNCIHITANKHKDKNNPRIEFELIPK